MPKIAIYHATLPRSRGKKGGVEASVHRLANLLVQGRRAEVTVFSSGAKPLDAAYNHVSVLNFSNRYRLTRIFLSPLLLNFINFSSFDILHYHGDDWFHFRRELPTVRTFHGSAKLESLSATSLTRKMLMGVVYLLELLSAKLARYRIGTNLETQMIYKTEEIIGNSVDVSLFSPAEKSENPTICFIGTWNGRKRGNFIYDIFVREILPKFPNSRLYMITDSCPAHESVSHLAQVSDQVLSKILAASWVFAYPSTYEGFGIPYIEALACGTAIVSSPNGGAAEVLVNGKFGLIKSDDAFGQAVINVLENKELRLRMQAEGLARSNDFSEAEIGLAIERVYFSLLK